ncbi:3-oxo-5alpha-steroid 4-dehydrogenase [Pseudomonas citronellolis]|uniref:3-oxo-5alpha-steroid 4-dehydrogenase n=1 Tax=Pseudomonas citronellolis TaxID=53408 RepID=A0AAQ1HPS6_9PSED|nr:FAD-binding protein [Pseudomonas citronellolis]TGC30259.1 delta 4, 5-alpha steroid dehydrogenase [Pseudomonas citronellolis]SFD18799.1 3-oxo-5alpha-steroid 4-dehydrogenase [Pseudomonas citronellolis]
MAATQPIAPLRLAEGAPPQWHAETDLLVVGFGGAGACAALEARERGLQVLALDRFTGGGATARSGGVVYAGGGTPQQRQAGYADDAQAMFSYLREEVGDVVQAETLRDFCQRSVEQLAWLERQGARYEASVPPQKTSYPSDRYYLYYSGNEAVPAYASLARPAPRGHRTKGRGMSGAALFGALRAAARAKDVQLYSQCEVRRLVQDASGAVVGVEAWRLPPGSAAARRHAWLGRLATAIHPYAPPLAERLTAALQRIEQRHAQPILLRARKGVLLSAGGFIFNRAMLAEHAPRYLAGLPLGTPGCDGSGIRLGLGVGAAAQHLDKVSAWRFINPPLAWARGVIVNAEGERYCNEEVYGAKLGHAMVEEQGGRAILVLDRNLLRESVRQVGPGKVWSFQRLPVLLNLLFNRRRGDTPEQLAQALGMPPANLRRTLEEYGRAARGEHTDAFGKSPAMLADLDDGPWYALDLSFDSKLYPCPAITLGGLRVCERSGRVLDATGQPIAGLYSAGRNAVGIASNLYVSGLSIADCVYSGRRAAAHAAAQAHAATPETA